MQETAPGQPMFKDMQALQEACKSLGLEIEQRNTYAWYNRHMGDYPVPPGIKVSDLGKNAVFVVKLNDEMRAKHSNGRTPYEIGMVEDPNNAGCFIPIYDFYCGGYGLEEVIGRPLFHGNDETKIKMLCPKLKQMYEVCCDKLAARAADDRIDILTLKDAHKKYPHLFPTPTDDEDTWVSVADPGPRMQAIDPAYGHNDALNAFLPHLG